MSPEERDSTATIEGLIRAADRLAKAIDELWEAFLDLKPEPAYLEYKTERALAIHADEFLTSITDVWAFCNELDYLINDPKVEGKIRTAEATVRKLVQRWGWDFIGQPDIEAVIEAKRATHNEAYEIPFLRTAMACTSLWLSSPESMAHPQERQIDDAYMEGRRRELTPVELPSDTSHETAQAMALDLHWRWLATPTLTLTRPSADNPERIAIVDAIDYAKQLGAEIRRLYKHAEPIDVPPDPQGVAMEEASKIRPTNSVPSRKSGNDPRDNWMYGRFIKGVPMSDIVVDLRTEAKKRKWKAIGTASGISKAIKRAALRWNINPPIHGQDRDNRRHNGT